MYPMPQYGHGGWSRGFSLPPGGIAGIGATAPTAGTQQSDASQVGSSLLASAGAISKLNPIAGAIVATAGALADIVSLFGPNPDNTYATEVVNQVEADVMQPNLAAYLALPTDQRTLANQAAAEANFNAGWAYVLQACNNVQLGSAGINCIKDRQRGGKFDWFAAYYTPIYSDTAPAANAALAAEAAAASTSTPAATTVTTTTNGVTTTTTTPVASTTNLYLWGGIGLLALGAVLLMGGD